MGIEKGEGREVGHRGVPPGTVSEPARQDTL